MAPEMFGSAVIGETLAADSRQLIGRTVDVSLIDISNDYSKFYVSVKLQISSVEGNKAHTALIGHDVMRERIYRMVQRQGRRVDAVQDVVTKDGVKLRVKTVFMLIKRVGMTKKDATRKLTRDLIEQAAAEMTFTDFIDSVIKGDLQHTLKKEASKIYPIGSIEIRKTEVTKVVQKVAA